jgi:membrane associated rhomboid family serine protease
MILIPIGTDRPRLRPSYLTITLIAVNVLVFLFGLLAPEQHAVVHTRQGVFRVPMDTTTVSLGLWSGHPTPAAFFTHMFAHGGVFHLAGNMLFLWVFGSLIEDALGALFLSIVYVGGGLLAAAAHIAVSRAAGGAADIPLVGASGAIAAIMGLFLLRFYRTRVRMFYWWGWWVRTFEVTAVWMLGIWLGMELIKGFLDMGAEGGVAHWAHIAGFVVGAGMAPFLGATRAAQEEYVTDDPEVNLEFVRRSEVVGAAAQRERAEPNNPYRKLELANALREAGQYEQACAAYVSAVKTFVARGFQPQALDAFARLLEYNDHALLDPSTHLKFALELEKSERQRLAITALSSLSEGKPTAPEAEQALLRLAHLRYHHDQNPAEAARCLDLFLKRYPNSAFRAQAERGRAQLAERMGRSFG